MNTPLLIYNVQSLSDKLEIRVNIACGRVGRVYVDPFYFCLAISKLAPLKLAACVANGARAVVIDLCLTHRANIQMSALGDKQPFVAILAEWQPLGA